MNSAFITGCAGEILTADEKHFLRDTRPAGFILFARNCVEPDQVKRLTDSVIEACQTDHMLVLIDQEGGRVQRLTPPHWRQYPAALDLAHLADANFEEGARALTLVNQAIATDLRALGINMNCTPVLDIPVKGAHDIIGTRAYGGDAEKTATYARIVAQACLSCGVAPVIKHVPGHGRSTKDSHKALPVVETSRAELEKTDFCPFKLLNDMPAAMTAHIIYSDIDASEPASTSAIVINDIIRDHMGFGGLLMSDDLSMHALEGTMKERTRAVLEAGCDLALHCNGDFDEMIEVSRNAPELTGKALSRLTNVLEKITAGGGDPAPIPDLDIKLDKLRAKIAHAT